MNEKLEILSLLINQINFEQAIEKVKILAIDHTPSYVCFANVHMVIEAYKNKGFANEVNNATLVLADGKPVAKACKLLYNQYQERIAGMDFMPRLLQSIEGKNAKIFFYGSDIKTLNALDKTIKDNYNGIQIAGAISPPYRPLSLDEQTGYIKTINRAKPHVVFVCLGCPKQEKWMYEHHKKIYQHQFDLLVTEISANNPRSQKAHEKVGFKTIHNYRDDIDEWNVVVWDWQ